MDSQLPKTTQAKFALIAQEALNSGEALSSERISRLLNATFDAKDYMDVLRKYPHPQQYVNGLYKVNYPYFVKFPFTYPFRCLDIPPPKLQYTDGAFGASGRPEERLVSFHPLTRLHLSSR